MKQLVTQNTVKKINAAKVGTYTDKVFMVVYNAHNLPFSDKSIKID